MAKRKTTHRKSKVSLERMLSEMPRIDSAKLSTLRRTVEGMTSLKEIIGPVVQFHVVIDANILIGEIIWSARRKKPSGRTDLQECIQAETIIAYATPHVVSEVERHLPNVISSKNLSAETCLAEWEIYKAMLRIEDPDPAVVEKYTGGQDPADAPTIALAEIIGALGIFSKDTDIAAMGGTCIPISFVLEARNYSRQAALNVTIQVGGYCIAVGFGHGLMAAIAVFEHCAAWLRGLRAEVKLLLLLATIMAFAHPRSRTIIVAAVKGFAERFPYKLAAEFFQCAMLLGDMIISNPAVPPSLSMQEGTVPEQFI